MPGQPFFHVSCSNSLTFNWPLQKRKVLKVHCIFLRHQEQKSQPVFLDKCRLYRMEAFMRELTGKDHISVGMRTPSGKYERPIPGTRLFWTKPGNFALI